MSAFIPALLQFLKDKHVGQFSAARLAALAFATSAIAYIFTVKQVDHYVLGELIGAALVALGLRKGVPGNGEATPPENTSAGSGAS